MYTYMHILHTTNIQKYAEHIFLSLVKIKGATSANSTCHLIKDMLISCEAICIPFLKSNGKWHHDCPQSGALIIHYPKKGYKDMESKR